MTHPNNIVNAMKLVGYSLSDMLPAYPGKDEAYVDQLLSDCALALSRPVISYGMLGIHPCNSRYFNVSEHGFRSNGTQQPWPPVKSKTSIFFFGGSTTVGFGVEDSQTIPAMLQRDLQVAGVQCEIYNFGSGNYTCRHEALRFLDMVDRGFIPDYAVFLDGYNECFYALMNQNLVSILDTLYKQEKKRRRLSYSGSLLDFAMTSYAERRKQQSNQNHLLENVDEEAGNFLSEAGIKNALLSSNKELQANEITEFHTRISSSVWERYLDSVAIIRAVAGRKGVKTLFVWQPVPLYKTTKEQRILERLYYVFRQCIFCSPIYNWLHIFKFPSKQNDQEFLELSGLGASLNDVHYVDISHYSASFCKEIAGAISNKLLSLISIKCPTKAGLKSKEESNDQRKE